MAIVLIALFGDFGWAVHQKREKPVAELYQGLILFIEDNELLVDCRNIFSMFFKNVRKRNGNAALLDMVGGNMPHGGLPCFSMGTLPHLQEHVQSQTSPVRLFPNCSATVDAINAHFGRGALFFASEGTERTWKMKREMLSGCPTTQWKDILVVKA